MARFKRFRASGPVAGQQSFLVVELAFQDAQSFVG